ncbi:MAG: polyphenol oxidase family protein, partial [Nitrospinae bacterium]|nr:polyphenol oxidase family protein [Nitrospinota bacterium]
AVFVKNPGLSVGVLTADCIPLILADPVQKTVCVVHAGRKGVFLNIVEKALARMNASKETAAVLGPFIRKCCYEVKDDVFENGFNDFKKYFNGGTLDIASAVIDQITSAGVLSKNIHDSGICTSCSVGEFFSHRREQGVAGRFMTGVCIK